MNALSRTARFAAAAAAGALLLVPAVDAKKKKPKPPQKAGVTYAGYTSQGANNCRSGGENTAPCSIFAGVSKDGKRVTEQVYFFAQCEDGKTFRSSTFAKNVTIKKGGKFTVQASYDEKLGDQGTAKNTVTNHGQFKRKGKGKATKYSVKGDFQLESDISFTDGTSTHCSTGKVTFTATYKKGETQG